VAEGGLQLGVVKALGAQPALVLAGPAGTGAIDATMAQQEGLQPPAGPAQVPDRLLARGGDADGDQLAGAVQPRQPPAVAPVGLGPYPRRLGG
jgi:hypothetical protein